MNEQAMERLGEAYRRDPTRERAESIARAIRRVHPEDQLMYIVDVGGIPVYSYAGPHRAVYVMNPRRIAPYFHKFLERAG